MRFFSFSLSVLFAADDARLSFVGCAARRRFSIFRKPNEFLSTIIGCVSLAFLSTTPFFWGETAFAQGTSSAQNVSSSANSAKSAPLTPEEVGGTSLRDFDATRAIGSDYLSNPDGGDIPLDEDDVWFPELALGKKDTSETSNGVRVVAFSDGSVSTETRGVPTTNIQTAPSSSSVSAPQTAQNIAPIQVAAATEPTVPVAPGKFQGYQPASTAAATSAASVAPAPIVGFQGYQPTSVPALAASSSNVAAETPASALDPFLNAPILAPQQVVSPTPAVETPLPSSQTVPPPLVAQNFETVPAPSSTVSLAAESVASQQGTPSYGDSEELVLPPTSPETLPVEPDSNEISLDDAKLSESDVDNLTVEDIRISGLDMTTQQFNKIIKTRIGAKFNRQRLEEDKRALLQTKRFVDVSISTTWRPDKPDYVVVNFDLIPRRLMKYIKIVGNRKTNRLDILEELGVKPGETRMDPYEVENGRIRIIEFYKSKDLPEPHVEILSGDRPEDVGVIYLIDEGLKQRVLKTTFVGNTIASSARLKSLIAVKPGICYFIGGSFSRARLDEDVAKLLDYYRRLGFFDARIDREYVEGEWFGGLGKDNAWVTVRYIIDEGKRYKIRNFLFDGNRVVSTPELEKNLKVKPGSYYNYDEIEADRIALRYQYQDLGYVRADITPTPLFTDEEGVLDLRYTVSEDHRYRVRDIIVDYVGTESRTKKSVVWNLLDLSPGELLNGRKIRMSENALQRSGYFNDKAAEGQLPEIAVVPDESRSFRAEKNGDTTVVKEARRRDESESASASGNILRDAKTEERDAGRNVPRSNDSKSNGGGNGATSKNPAASDSGSSRFGQSELKTSGVYRAAYPPTDGGIPANFSNGAGLEDAANFGNGVNFAAVPLYRSYAPSVVEPLQSPPVLAGSNGSASVVRAQTRQIPAGFSGQTTRASATTNASDAGYTGYSSYDSTNGTSQYSSGSDYANYDSSDLNASSAFSTDEESTAPGFADGVYSSIGKEIVEPITPDEDEIYDGDVLVKVQEGRTGMFTASIGVNSDYGLVGNVSFEERNFDLFRPPTSLCRLDGWKDAFRGGGQIFKVQASPGTTVQRYSVSWDVPYVLNTKNTFGVTALYGDHSFDEWFETRYGGEMRLGRQWTNRFSTTLNGGAYKVKISDPSVSYVPDLTSAVGSHNEFDLGLSAAYDVRNHPFSPSEGFLLKGSLEEVLGDYQFPRASLDARYYKTLHKRVDQSGRWVLGLSSRVGWNGDGAPIYERYYGGGSTNLRGFEYRGVTPRYADTTFGIGGNFEFYNTAELLVPLSGGDEFKFALFVDTGTVATSVKDWGTYRVSPGFGFRVSIPMLGPAPLALDFAFPVVKNDQDVTEVFSFSMSGSR